MENRASMGSSNQVNSEEIPSLFQTINSKSVAGFDEYSTHASTPRSDVPFDKEIEVVPMVPQTKSGTPLLKSPDHPEGSSHSVRSSTPNTQSSKRVMFSKEIFMNGKSNLSTDSPDPNMQQTKQKYQSQSIMSDGGDINSLAGRSKSSKLRDNRFDSFKTFSGKLERQITNLRGKPPTPESASNINNALRQKSNLRESALPADRYFAALEGPELDTLKASEVSALPDNKKWPFLLRFPISSFGICLGVSSQVILWKTLAVTSSTKFLHVNLYVNLVLWYISIVLFAAISIIYLLKIILYFEAIRREYYHPIRINFFFAPWIACLFLALGVPPSVTEQLPSFSWYILMTPLLCLELKLYGQWMSGGQRRLSKVANPSNHLSVVGNFVGALLGASMGLKEGSIFFFSVGLAHYIVLFVTLYQRLPTNETLPVELHPVFFLFVAVPSVASMAWENISGSFDYASRIAYFIAIFLYFSLAVRINFFRGFRFSLAWWAYTFPMTVTAIVTIRYSKAVQHPFTQALAVILTAIATITVLGLLISTIVHAFVLRDLFPNDISIAVTETKETRFHLDLHLPWTASTEADLENALQLRPTKSDPSGLNSELDR